MRRTKIVCTIGPASTDEKILEQMIKNGMNVARLNFSHGTHEYHGEVIKLIKDVRDRLRASVAIMLDTKGPEIRIKCFRDGNATICPGDKFTLTTREVDGDATEVSVTYPDLPGQITKGSVILIDDGMIELRAEETTDTDVICTVVRGGALSNRKGINLPHTRIEMPYLSEQDKSDLIFGIQNDVDFISASFVRSKEDVIALRKYVDYYGGHSIRIISKIENLVGIENFDEILKLSDGIMVARGDMGVEVDFERLPGLQKRFIKKCYQSGKMVITATQMLESMIQNPSPTRAEITDVANAVFDGTSAVMLSGETAMGKYPVEAVQVMAKISEQAEKDAFEMDVYKGVNYENDTKDMTNAVCDAACITARDIKAKAIVALTKFGQTARRVSKFRPYETIVAATPVEKTFHQLSLSWGVQPVIARYQQNSDELIQHAIDCARKIDAVSSGDTIVVIAGVPLDTPGNTNLLKVETVRTDY